MEEVCSTVSTAGCIPLNETDKPEHIRQHGGAFELSVSACRLMWWFSSSGVLLSLHFQQ